MYSPDKGNLIKNIVRDKKTDSESIQILLEFKKIDNEIMPITHAPIKSLSIAALHILGIECFNGNDPDVNCFIQIFQDVYNHPEYY